MRKEAESSRKWRFTWEAQSHQPTLKLFLFNNQADRKIPCRCLDVSLNSRQSEVQVSFVADGDELVLLGVPVPRVLIDNESPLSFRAMDDHIEVKITLLLPVDHPIVSDFDSMLSLSEDRGGSPVTDDVEPLSMDTDIQNLSSMEEVNFYCRNCSTKLTSSPISNFVEMPSTNWQEAADNWFGGCCSSFGGISEKLAGKYALSYMTTRGSCLLNSTTIIVCMDDLAWELPKLDEDINEEYKPLLVNNDGLAGRLFDSGSVAGTRSCDELKEEKHMYNEKPNSLQLDGCQSANVVFPTSQDKSNHESLYCQHPDLSENGVLESGHAHETNDVSCCKTDECAYLELDGKFRNLTFTKESELLENQKSFLNGFLGDVFMAKYYNLSAVVKWVEFVCPNCSALVGAYPHSDGCAPMDRGVRLFKCYISTALPILESSDKFRKYTLERMFVNQILQNARDELSYRTVIMDLETRSPMLQIILLNPNSWHCTGYCLNGESLSESSQKVSLLSAVKLLFCDSRNNTLSQQTTVEEWSAKHIVDEVFMLKHQIETLVGILVSAKELFPPSFTLLEGFNLTSLQR